MNKIQKDWFTRYSTSSKCVQQGVPNVFNNVFQMCSTMCSKCVQKCVANVFQMCSTMCSKCVQQCVPNVFSNWFSTVLAVNYVRKTLHLRCLAGFWRHLWISCHQLLFSKRNIFCNSTENTCSETLCLVNLQA